MSNQIQILKPRIALNKAYLKVKPNRAEIESFRTNLTQLLNRINDNESEEFHKNLVSDFLKDTYYKQRHFINTKGRNDLVIHNTNNAADTVGVIIETKKPTNRNEMLSKEKVNTKAFQELVLYYLRERITHKNIEIKHIIATNINEWFIFDATLFDRLFAQNKALVKQFVDFEDGRLPDTKTDFFYKQVAEPFIDEIKHNIEFTYFDIRDFKKSLYNTNKEGDNQLITLFKLLSPEHLLKLPFANDSNSLDKRFYSELLYIIGLTETKDGGKKLIERNKEGERNTASLLENAILQLDSLNKISRIENPTLFGANLQERLFNIGLELCITWINRILFLKLLEAQLIGYHKGDKSYEFLSFDKIKDYDNLNRLFFQVLARKHDNRHEEVKSLFSKVPYLNSSLFEPTDIEHSYLFISQLHNDITLPIYTQTVLKDSTGKKRTGSLNPLEYLFEFLNSYDFASEGSEEIQEYNKTLINASVLGLIFEKINGYKDGSFFTPGFITMYMCRETIRRAVVQKFNDTKGWNCTTLKNIYDKIEDRDEANDIVNSIKICDIAVGSGHFLVSALNEIIAIKSDLKILQDRDGRRLKEYHLEVVNDELIITDDDGDLFEYNPNNKESLRLQETLFHEKQTIIENCLFGVDLNPNSVKICRLRLWIELLKNAYYKNENELETLPNIDINIKCGNSLISRFALDTDLKQALRKISSKWTIDSYRLAVATYRNAKSKEQKREMESLILKIKQDFTSEIRKNDPLKTKLDKLANELYNKFTGNFLFDANEQYGAKNKDIDKKRKSERERLEKEISDISNKIDEIKENRVFEKAFEWRFEFPEVLDDNGNFVGFDVVIGNPPYGVNVTLSEYPISDSFLIFYLRGYNLLNKNGLLCYISPDSWLTNNNAKIIRELFAKNGCIHSIRDVYKVFSDAPDVWCNIPIFQKNGKCIETKISRDFPFDMDMFQFSITWERLKRREGAPWFIYINDGFSSIFEKMRKNLSAKNFVNINRGYSPSPNPINLTDTKTERPVIGGEDFGRYEYKIKPKYLINSYLKSYESIRETLNKEFIGVQRIRTNSLKINSRWLVCQYFESGYVPIDSISFITTTSNISLKCILAILNSKLLNIYYKLHYSDKNVKPIYLLELPIPEINEPTSQILNTLVDELLEKKASDNSDIKKLENQIDLIVYKLYSLTDEEINIIENT